MFTNLPKVTWSIEGIAEGEKVSARELHKWLGYKRGFSKWLLRCLLTHRILNVSADCVVFSEELEPKDLMLDMDTVKRIVLEATGYSEDLEEPERPPVAYNPNTGYINLNVGKCDE